MGTAWVGIVEHENKVECLWQFGNDCEEVARSEVGYLITEFTQKFVCVLLAVGTSNNPLTPGSTGIAVMVIEHSVKALWNLDWELRKVWSTIQHMGHPEVQFPVQALGYKVSGEAGRRQPRSCADAYL